LWRDLFLYSSGGRGKLLRLRKSLPKFTSSHNAIVETIRHRSSNFGNDGTLWCEQPMHVQIAFVLDRVTGADECWQSCRIPKFSLFQAFNIPLFDE
jgi:hypothetical protein